jgi:hypothetical protein
MTPPAAHKNDSSAHPEWPHSSPPRLKQTVLGAAIGALLAMAFVPCISGGYQPIFNAAEYSINIPQLVLNVLFATVLGAVIFNLVRFRVALWTIAIAALAFLAAAYEFPIFQEKMEDGANSEEAIANDAIHGGDFESAKEHLLKEANYWWWKGWWEGARRAKKQANDQAGMEKEYAQYLHWDDQGPKPKVKRESEIDLSNLPDQGPPPIKRALPVSPAPTALKIPASPPNH